ncbi:MAG: metallophosphoesterase [Kofleriaceae bacterium]|nr:metallophosphoesterase [Kofleriaceae bacterium]
MRSAGFGCLLALFAAACDRSNAREGAPPQSVATTPAAPAAPARTCTLAPIAAKLPAPKRMVAIGDLHGDLAAARAALRTAGAIDTNDTWIGGDLVVVQTGDILDRGDDEQAILDLMFALEGQAKAAGGAVVMLLGNHELMNAAGDFRYVTRGGMTDFTGVPGVDPNAWPQVPEAARARFAALAPGGLYAKKLAAHNVIAIVGDTVFSHAGVLDEWVTQVDAVNLSSRCWLDGQGGGPREPPPSLTSEDSPVWTRAIGGPDAACSKVSRALEALGAKYMVVGHTVQDGGISSACDGTVWRIDVGLAKHYGGPIEVLELVPDAPPRILKGAR